MLNVNVNSANDNVLISTFFSSIQNIRHCNCLSMHFFCLQIIMETTGTLILLDILYRFMTYNPKSISVCNTPKCEEYQGG